MATEFLLRCLRSVSAAPPLCSFETIVIDNASPEFDRAAVLAEIAAVTIVQNDSNLGYAAACNQAAELASGEFVLLCNPDIEFEAGTIDKLRDFLLQNPEAAGAAPQLVYLSGKVQASCRGFPTPAALLFEATGLARLFRRNERLASYRMTYFDHAATREVQQPMASCLMLRRQALDEVGPLDEEFPIFFNDVDWAMRAAARGWKMYFVAEARAVHHLGRSTRHMGARRASESYRSLLRLYRKHYKESTSWLIYHPIVALIAAGGSLRTIALGLREVAFRRE